MASDKPDNPPKSGKPKSFVETSRTLTVASDPSLKGKLPDDILSAYEVHQWKHAGAILKGDFPKEHEDIVSVLRAFKVRHGHIVEGGGGKTDLAQSLDDQFRLKGWIPKRWDTKIVIDETSHDSPTHEVDCYKNRVALEIEWNNKDPFYDRDLNNFRLLFDLRVISVGAIVTKSDDMAALFHDLGIWSKYGTSTTWMHKLLPRVNGGGGGGCPLLVFGIKRSHYTKD